MESQPDKFEHLKQCTVKISIPGKTGTGFFVAPGLILTCVHVVKDTPANSSVEVYWNDPSHLQHDTSHPAQITSCNQDADLAQLRVDLSGHPYVQLNEKAEPLDILYSYGYTDKRPGGDPATFVLEGKAGEQGEELKLKGGQAQPGISGAPILNTKTGYVCGVVRLTRDKETDLGGWGISATKVFEAFPNLKTIQQELLPGGGRWTRLFKQGPASTPEVSDREKMLSAVYDKWITRYLVPSLHPASELIQLRLHKEPSALSRLPQEENRPIDSYPPGTTIRKVYDKADGQLLILGEPGSGKTVLLLALARTLLEDAALDDTYPMPIVFKLSSWAAWAMKQQKRQPTLNDWLIEELKTKYDRPVEIGRPWIKDDNVLPLLDGLDEMDFAQQTACIRAINGYLQEHGKGVRIVVSCRRKDYFLHKEERLNLQKAVTVQPLEEEQITDYLSSTGEHLENLETVRQALRDYPTVRELAEIPLMLNIITQAYDEVPIQKLAATSSPQAQRQQIFEAFVKQMLKPPGGITPHGQSRTERWLAWLLKPPGGITLPYGQSQTERWLAWLADQLTQHNQPEFYIERIQPNWLPDKRSRLLYRFIVSGLAGGLVGGLSFGLIIRLFSYLVHIPVVVLPLLAVSVGLIGWLIAFLVSAEIKPVENLSWSWANVWRDLPGSLVIGLVGAVILGLITYWLSNTFNKLPLSIELVLYELGIGALYVLLSIVDYALVGTLIGWLAGLAYGFLRRKLRRHNLIMLYQDKRYFAWTGTLIGIVIGVSELLVFALDKNSSGANNLSLIDRFLRDRFVSGTELSTIYLRYDLIYGIVSGLLAGLFGGLVFGLSHGLSGKKLDERNLSAPNQGIRRSARKSVGIGLLVGLFVGLVVGLTIELGGFRLADGLVAGLLFALASGLISGLSNGGYASIQHFFLRLFLYRAGSMPWCYSCFLDYASNLKLLRKLGGSYIFFHSRLQEYFTSLNTTSVPDTAAQQEEHAL